MDGAAKSASIWSSLSTLSKLRDGKDSLCPPSPWACPHVSPTARPCGPGWSAGSKGHSETSAHCAWTQAWPRVSGHVSPVSGPLPRRQTRCQWPQDPGATTVRLTPCSSQPRGRAQEKARDPASPVLRGDGKGPAGHPGLELVPAWITGPSFSFSFKSFEANISHQKPTTGG